MSIRKKNIRITPAKLRAQRANARLSRGPRTREGRRRSSLNRRHMEIAWPFQWLERDQARELRRVWRDLVAAFWFADPAFLPGLRRTLKTLRWYGDPAARREKLDLEIGR